MAVSATFDAPAWESWDGPDPAGANPVRWKLLFSRGLTPTTDMCMGLAEIAPGGRLPLHHHAPAEIYHVLAGEGRCDVEGVAHEMLPGVSLFIPPDALHATTNTGERPLRFLFVFPTDAFDDVEYHFEAQPS